MRKKIASPYQITTTIRATTVPFDLGFAVCEALSFSIEMNFTHAQRLLRLRRGDRSGSDRYPPGVWRAIFFAVRLGKVANSLRHCLRLRIGTIIPCASPEPGRTPKEEEQPTTGLRAGDSEKEEEPQATCPVSRFYSFSSTANAASCPTAKPRRERSLRMDSSESAPRPARPSMNTDSGPERTPSRR